jgi:hypothetical protein
MSPEEMAAEIRRLRDRQDILDAISAYARGTDRHDAQIVESSFHSDAVDQHGGRQMQAAEISATLNAGHASSSRAHTHNITTHTCEIDGDQAHAETYVLAGLAASNGSTVRLYGARYVDRLERRGSGWRIAARRVLIDWIMTGPADVFHAPEFRALGYPSGTWDRSDPSYDRPLRVEGDPEPPSRSR